MKSFLKYKFLLVLLGLFQLPSNILWAQNPELSNHTWYFNHGEIDGNEFLLPESDFTTALYIHNQGINFIYIVCNQGWGINGIIFNSESENFFLSSEETIFIGLGEECSNIQLEFILLHTSIYLTNDNLTNTPIRKSKIKSA